VFVVQEAKKVAFRPVETGIMGDTDLEIVTGLQEGEEIVSGSYKTLRTLQEDARIKIEDKSKKKSWAWLRS
jgi:HlyD family secretion protein